MVKTETSITKTHTKQSKNLSNINFCPKENTQRSAYGKLFNLKTCGTCLLYICIKHFDKGFEVTKNVKIS